MPHLSGLEIGSLLETCNLPGSPLLAVDSILEEIFLEEKKHEKIVAKLIDMMNWSSLPKQKKEAEESEILE